MSGSIIDADKLQNAAFTKKDWLITTDYKPDTIVLQRTELEIKKQCELLSHMVKKKYNYHQVDVSYKVKE